MTLQELDARFAAASPAERQRILAQLRRLVDATLTTKAHTTPLPHDTAELIDAVDEALQDGSL